MKKLIVITTLAVLGLGAAGAGIFWYVRQNTGLRLLNKALVAMQAKNYRKAVTVAERYIGQEPEDWRGHNVLGRACMQMGRYEDARSAFRAAARLEPSQIGPVLGLAGSYAAPAAQGLSRQEAGSPVDALREVIDGFLQANDIILRAKATDPASALDLRERLGRDHRSIALAWRAVSDRLGTEADRAEKARLSKLMVNARREAGAEADTQARKANARAITTLLAVVREDPSRPIAAQVLVDMCIEQGDRDSLAEARKAILALDSPPALAGMSLALYDLRSSMTAGQEVCPDKLKQFCGELDRLLRSHPDELLVRLARAEAAYMLKDYPTAERIANAIIEDNPRQGRARLVRAGVLMGRRKFEDAERELFALKADFPKWADAHYAFAMAAMHCGRTQVAMRALRATADLNADHGGARRHLAERLVRGGFYAEAFDDARAYYRAHPHEPSAVRLLVQAAAGLPSPPLALAHRVLEEARSSHGDRPEMMYTVGEGYERLGEKAQAAQAFQRTAGLRPVSPADRLAVAKALREIGRIAEAEKAFVDELARKANRPHVHYEMSRLCLATGRPMQAVDHLRTAMGLDPQNGGYRMALAQLWFDAGDIPQCEKALADLDANDVEANLLRLRVRLVKRRSISAEDMIQQIDRRTQAGLALAMTYLKTGRPQWCADVCEAALRNNPNDSDLLFLLGQTYLTMGHKAKCRAQWAQAVRAAPQQLPAYLSLAGLLAADLDPPQVAQALGRVPRSRNDMVQLAIGWLHSRRGDFAMAARTYGALADDGKAPDYSRKRARLLKARVLASAGRLDQALAELNTLGRDKTWHRGVLQARADILADAGRGDQALAALVSLGHIATADKDTPALRRIAAQMMDLGGFAEALTLCDRVQRLLPRDARTYLLRASVLSAAGRRAETPDLLAKAIALQPANPKLHVALAMTYDDLERPEQALEALQRLEALGRTGKARALFERGRLLARWGLVARAEECFAKLDAKGYSDNLSLRLTVGRALVAVGSAERAKKILDKVPVHCDQHVAAQLLLADQADGAQARLAILERLAEAKPNDPVVLQRLMRSQILCGRAARAVKAFHDFVKRTARIRAVPESAYRLALRAMLEADDCLGAAKFARERAESSPSRHWRHFGLLLSVDDRPELAAEMLPDPGAAGPVDALLGVVVSTAMNARDARDVWVRRVDEIGLPAPKRKPPAGVPARYRLLAALAGRAKRNLADLDALARSANVGPAAGGELVAARARPGARAEAAALLKATLAADWGMAHLGRTWALGVLEARPTCQWAAALVMQTHPDAASHRKVLALLRPETCALWLRIRGSLRRDEGAFAEAAALYGRAVQAAGDDPLLVLAQAVVTERLGRFEEALALYRKVWQATKDPQAGNNAAFIVSQLHPTDMAQLTEALQWASAAVEAEPNDPAYRDTRGWILFLLGRTGEARRDIRRALKGMPGSPEVQYHAGMVEAKAPAHEISRWHLRAALAAADRIKARGGKLTASADKAAALAGKALAANGQK